MSVKTIWISGRASRMAIASSALPASTTSKPASETIRRADPEQQLIFHDENDRPPDY
jgi:hypothetical protein